MEFFPHSSHRAGDLVLEQNLDKDSLAQVSEVGLRDIQERSARRSTHPLELRIQPGIVALAIALAMRMSSRGSGNSPSRSEHFWILLPCSVLGIAIGSAAVYAFRRAKTTIHAERPNRTTKLVTIGVYRYSRNPMYLGLAVLLIAWAIALSNPRSLWGPVIFVVYITRFQILPEERALKRNFGTAYAEYLRSVRRWI